MRPILFVLVLLLLAAPRVSAQKDSPQKDSPRNDSAKHGSLQSGTMQKNVTQKDATSAGSLQKTSRLGAPTFPNLEYVNLSGELGFSGDILRGFGARVDDARRAADAEALAAQAVLLAFAEELAGRHAKTVAAIAVLAEAARIAEEQQNRDAARAVIAAAARIPGSDGVRARMTTAVAMFSAQRGEGDLIGYVRIENKCDRILDAYVDGKYVGFLYDGEAATYSSGNGTTTARVVDAFGNTVNTIIYVKPDETFTWTIAP